MVIENISEDKKEEFNIAALHPLQSWEWGEFRKKTGNKVARLMVTDKKGKKDAIQITLHEIPFTNYKIAAYIKGPTPTKKIIEALKNLACKENLIFIKIEPSTVLKNDEKLKIVKLLKENGATEGKTLFTPTTFWIDLTPSEEDLLKSFQSKTRYNIKLAQKKGVKVVEDNSENAFENYISLTKETVERQGFYAHTEKYHRLMWQVLHKDMVDRGESPIARLLTAVYEKEIVTTWILFVWHDFLYYPYGASTDKHKNVMANNLMMWEAIRYGKKTGLKTFDLWGREEGKGFTKFKEGYNPKVVEFLGTWDLATLPQVYPFYKLADTVRWKILRLRTTIQPLKPAF